MIGINLSGAEFGTGNVYGRDYVYPGLSDLQFYTGEGISLVRLPVRWERLQPSLDGPLDPAELGRLKTFLGEAAASGASVIVDLHNFGRYNGNVLGSAGAPTAAFARFWATLAAEIGTLPGLAGYDLMNEPHSMGGPTVWPTAAQAAIDAIRAVDSRTAIYVEGDQWAGSNNWSRNNPNLLLNDPADNLVYQAHVYFDRYGAGTYSESYDEQGAHPLLGMQRLQSFAKWLEVNNVRGMIGEVAVPKDDPRWLVVLDNFLAAAEANDIDVAYWGGGPWWGNYALAPRNSATGAANPQLAVLQKYIGDPQPLALAGDGGANTLTGGRGADAIESGSGDDVLSGRGGADRLDGGGGRDAAVYRASPQAVDIDLARASQLGGHAAGDVLRSIETVRGSGFGDVLRGTAGAEMLYGHAGADQLEGRGGGDLLDGGYGRDTAVYGTAVVIDLALAIQANGDQLVAIENITASAFADRLIGDARINVLTGGDGDDWLEGRGGSDTLDGGNGIDTASFAGGSAKVVASLMTGRASSSDTGVDRLSGIENLVGSGADDGLTGSAAANRLDGGTGNDRLTGLGGADVLIGGGGSDRFVFAALADSGLAAPDMIADFARGFDRIELSAIDAMATRAGNQKFAFVGTSGFTAAGQLRIDTATPGLTKVFANVDADLAPDLLILVATPQPLQLADFVL